MRTMIGIDEGSNSILVESLGKMRGMWTATFYDGDKE